MLHLDPGNFLLNTVPFFSVLQTWQMSWDQSREQTGHHAFVALVGERTPYCSCLDGTWVLICECGPSENRKLSQPKIFIPLILMWGFSMEIGKYTFLDVGNTLNLFSWQIYSELVCKWLRAGREEKLRSQSSSNERQHQYHTHEARERGLGRQSRMNYVCRGLFWTFCIVLYLLVLSVRFALLSLHLKDCISNI